LDWFEATEFPDSVFRLREPALRPLHGSNSWLVLGERRALLIDTGVGVAPLAPVVRGLTAKPVICLLSHTHYDHIGGAHEFADRRVHRLEAAILADPTPQATQWAGWFGAASFERLPPGGFDPAGYCITPAPATELLEGGEIIDLGGRTIEILHAPGHSPGLLCAFDRSCGALFTSDALYDGPMFFDLAGSDAVAAAHSLERLLATQARVAYPGHFESLTSEEFRRLGVEALARLQALEPRQ
jgi:glyoxylase-like metal-dependent hydrolase (beta-lactamase superfamily II)